MDRIQVNKEHYAFTEYVDWRRWLSYYWQIKEVIESGSKKTLVIGVGDGIIPVLIQRMTGGIVDTFDYDEDLNPTICGDIREIDKLVHEKYECIVCCQVLEHIDYSYFERELLSLRKICSRRLILSLPVRRTEFSLYVDIPRCREIKKINIIIQKIWKTEVSVEKEHKWEVGIRGKSKKRIKMIVNKYFNVMKAYHAPGNTFHWFIIGDVHR